MTKTYFQRVTLPSFRRANKTQREAGFRSMAGQFKITGFVSAPGTPVQAESGILVLEALFYWVKGNIIFDSKCHTEERLNSGGK